MPSYPHIEHKDKTYFMVACAKCGLPDIIKLYYDGRGNFIFKCDCGHVTEIKKENAKDKLDGVEEQCKS